MDNNGLIGHTGFVGSIIKPMFNFNKFYTRANVISLPNSTFNLLVCAAPTGNRLEVQNDPSNDLDMILTLIDHLRKTKFNHFVLISTIDVLAKPNTRYGMNRKLLEGWVKNNLENYSILRLPTLIHPDIKKNILYDLKHNRFVDKINPEAVNQYYDLTKLKSDLDAAVNSDINEFNLFSEPIKNQEIIDKFFPNAIVGRGLNPSIYNCNPMLYTKEEIFKSMEKYFDEVPLHLW